MHSNVYTHTYIDHIIGDVIRGGCGGRSAGSHCEPYTNVLFGSVAGHRSARTPSPLPLPTPTPSPPPSYACIQMRPKRHDTRRACGAVPCAVRRPPCRVVCLTTWTRTLACVCCAALTGRNNRTAWQREPTASTQYRGPSARRVASPLATQPAT